MTAFYTTAEVAAERRISEWQVRRLAKAKGIGEKHGNRGGWRFTREDIDALFADARQAPVARRRKRRSA